MSDLRQYMQRASEVGCARDCRCALHTAGQMAASMKDEERDVLLVGDLHRFTLADLYKQARAKGLVSALNQYGF